ncbi:PEP-CTERM sorting domain-containing protein [Prosthecobacter sp.]|uniref:PEP-CTERM sorting domain-containing protein n=1 Tax=Prosthecobacter sp. TaxID=1965333 RepID=UPI003785083D
MFEATGDPFHNTTAPTGAFLNSGWQYEGSYGAYLGTMIAPQYFITAQHFGTQGSTFTQSSTFNGVGDMTYHIDAAANGGLGYWDIAGTDLRIFKIQEYFSSYAPLYTGSSETGMTMEINGRGGPRGADVLVGSALHGWQETTPDGVARWGSNTVSGIYSSAIGDLLTASFSASGTAEEATLSNGDSGGGVFVDDGGIWKLAGVNYSIDGMFDTNNVVGDGSDFNAALFDRGGLYQGSDAFGWSLVPDLPLDNPSSMYASRISTSADAIMAIAVVPEPSSALLLALAIACSVTTRRRLTRRA